jgi:hypothetical protein
MSILNLSSRPRTLLILLLVALCGAVALAVRAAGGPEPREVTLLARGMAFYLPGDPTPNPRLTVERGEELRFVLRNEDRGMPHDLEVPQDGGERKATREVRGLGDTDSLTFRAPETPGDYEYVCTLHARMMRGVLEVR